MTYLAICGIVAFFTGAPCALFVIFNKPLNAMKIIWCLFGMGVSLWGFGCFYLFTAQDAQVALFWGRVINIIAIFIPIFFFHFVVLLTNTFKENKIEVLIYYLITLIYWCLAIIFYQSYVPSVTAKVGTTFYPDAGALYKFFPYMYGYLTIRGLMILKLSHDKVSSIRRNQYKYFLLASVIGMVGGGMTFFPVLNVPIFPFTMIAVPFFHVTVAYLILKHNLMDIRVIIRRSLIYTILIFFLTVFYMAAVYSLGRIFQNTLGYESTIGSIGVFVVMAILCVPLKDYVQSFVDKFFFKASYLQMVEENDLLRQQVLRAQRYETMSTFSKSIITELRNPLTALVGYGHHLPKRLNDAAFMDKFIQVYDKELARIQVLVKRLAEFSTPQQLELKEENLTPIVLEAMTKIEAILKDKKINLVKYMLEDRQLTVSIDAKQIKQALNNFLLSAIHSIPDKGGQIWIGLEEMDDRIELRIKDTGKGFTPDELTRIFDPLFDQEVEDANFGISAAQTIIHNHGGKVIVDSEPGVGTEWIIHLPRIKR